MRRREWERSLDLFHRYVTLCKAIFTEEHGDTLHGYLDLSETHRRKGDFQAALEVANKAKELWDSFDPISRGMGCAINAVALALQEQGKTTAAIECFEEGLRVFEKAVGFVDPDYAQNLLNLAGAIPVTRRTVALTRRALNIRRNYYGLHAKPTIELIAEVAFCYDRLGQRRTAGRYHSLAVAIAAKEEARRSVPSRKTRMDQTTRESSDRVSALALSVESSAYPIKWLRLLRRPSFKFATSGNGIPIRHVHPFDQATLISNS